MKRLTVVMVLVANAAGCKDSSAPSTPPPKAAEPTAAPPKTPAPTPAPAPAPAPSSTKSLHDVDWKTYYETVARGSDTADMGVPVFEDAAYGAIGVDTTEQAVVRIMIPGMKSQQLDVYTLKDGKPSLVGTIDGGYRSDGGVSSVKVHDNAIWIDRSELAKGDCMACASEIQSERWIWKDGKLQEDVAKRSRHKNPDKH